MRSRMRRLAAAAAATIPVLAGCGAGSGGPLAGTERAMATLDAGRIDLTVAASTAGAPAQRVGFRLEGPFAVQAGQEFPTFNLRATALLGQRQQVTQVVSDGEAVDVVHDGRRTRVPPETARLLRLGDGQGGFADLGVAGWVQKPVVVARPDGSRVVSGRIDAADLLSDLVRISGQVAGTDQRPLDGDAARRLNRLVRGSDFTAELGADHLPRHLRAVVDFGAGAPPELHEVLGPYAHPRLELTLSVEPADH